MEDNLSKKLGEKIRVLRLAKGYSQNNMAEMLEMSPSGYAKIERGDSNITLAKLEKVAKIFDLQANELLSLPQADCIFFNYSSGNQAKSIQELHSYYAQIHNYSQIQPELINLFQNNFTLLQNMIEKLAKRIEDLEKKV